ncbi:MAG: hypothetical protein ACR2OH_10340 [Microthrixaceae bacterium]
MKITSLRARLPGARPTQLHERVTVLAGLSAEDREALRSTFSALTTSGPAGLEAVLRVDGMTVPLDESFASTYDLLGAGSCVIEVPDDAQMAVSGLSGASQAAGIGGQGAEGAEHSNVASLTRLRTRREAMRSELTIVERALAEEQSTRGAPGRVDVARAGVGVPTATARELTDQLGSVLAARPATDAIDLADRLDELARHRITLDAREAALAQLMSECRIAIDSVQDALVSPASSTASGGELLPQVEALRSEMVEIAAGPLSRRARSRLASLRGNEAQLLSSAGFTSYEELRESVRSHTPEGVDAFASASARLELLHELEGFWAERREQVSAERIEESELLAEAERVLGMPLGGQPNPRLVAVKLRSRRPAVSSPESSAKLLAGRLGAELGYDTLEAFTPREVLELAEAEIDAADAAAGSSGGASGVGEIAHAWGNQAPMEELQQRRTELARDLRDIESRLLALDRAVDLGGAASEQADTAGTAGGGWSLSAQLQSRRSLPQVGELPILLIEPPSGPTALDAIDVPTVVAHSAQRQIVWVTDRTEVISGMEILGNLGLTIIA